MRSSHSKISPFLKSAVETIVLSDSLFVREGVAGNRRLLRQQLRPGGRDQEGVFDAHAESSGKINARLDGDHHALLQLVLGARADAGMLMNVDPDAVTRAVNEGFPVTALGDDLPADPVNRARRHPR